MTVIYKVPVIPGKTGAVRPIRTCDACQRLKQYTRTVVTDGIVLNVCTDHIRCNSEWSSK